MLFDQKRNHDELIIVDPNGFAFHLILLLSIDLVFDLDDLVGKLLVYFNEILPILKIFVVLIIQILEVVE